MSAHNETGQLGERLAAAYFEARGYDILHKNWRCRNWEIDLIATREKMLHFIEVKTVRSLTFGHPEERVSKKKLRYLIDAAEEFLYRNPEWPRVQFDVLAITMLRGKDVEYFLIEDVYE